MPQTACLVVNPIIVTLYAYTSLFNCTTAVGASDNDGLFLKLKTVVDDMYFAWPAVVQLLVFIYYGIQKN